jgi:hypothetical protein
MSVATCELEKLIAELALTREDLRSLEAKIEITAEQLGI